MELNGYDTFLLGMLLSFTLLGAYWGIIRQVISVIGLVVGVAMGGQFGPSVAAWLSSFIGEPPFAAAIGFFIVMISVSAVASLLASAIRFTLGLIFLGWLDHALGALLGLVQAVLAGAALTIVFIVFPNERWNSWIDNSQFAGFVVGAGGLLFTVLPSFFETTVQTLFGR